VQWCSATVVESLRLMDLEGQVVYERELSNASGQTTIIRTAQLSPGFYLLQLQTAAGQVSRKVAIER